MLLLIKFQILILRKVVRKYLRQFFLQSLRLFKRKLIKSPFLQVL